MFLKFFCFFFRKILFKAVKIVRKMNINSKMLIKIVYINTS